MTRGMEILGEHGHGIDAMLFEYLQSYDRHDITTEPDHERIGWNNALTHIGTNIAYNADFSQWLVDQFHDKETAAAYISAFNEFIRRDLFTNEQKN